MGLVAMGAGLLDFTRSRGEAVVPHALRHIAAVGTAWLGLRGDTLPAARRLVG